MLISLGNFQFHLATAAYETLTRITEAIWARQPILSSHEKLQAVGNANDVIQLNGTVYPQQAVRYGGVGSTESIDELRDMLKSLTPQRITAVNGKTWGFWVIERLLQQDSRWISDGTPRKQDFRLQLRYYGQSYDGTTAQDKPRAFGAFGPGPRPVTTPRNPRTRSLSQIGPQAQAPALTQPQVLDKQFKSEIVQDATAAVSNTEALVKEGERIEAATEAIEKTQDSLDETLTATEDQIAEVKRNGASIEKSLDSIRQSTEEIEANAAEAQTRVERVKARAQQISANTNERARTIRAAIDSKTDTVIEKAREVTEKSRELRSSVNQQKAQIQAKISAFRETTSDVYGEYGETVDAVKTSLNAPTRAVQSINAQANQEVRELKQQADNLKAEVDTFGHQVQATKTISQTLHEQYGKANADLLAQTLDLNPGLASEPMRLPGGHEIELPIIEQPDTPSIELETLW